MCAAGLWQRNRNADRTDSRGSHYGPNGDAASVVRSLGNAVALGGAFGHAATLGQADGYTTSHRDAFARAHGVVDRADLRPDQQLVRS